MELLMVLLGCGQLLDVPLHDFAGRLVADHGLLVTFFMLVEVFMCGLIIGVAIGVAADGQPFIENRRTEVQLATEQLLAPIGALLVSTSPSTSPAEGLSDRAA